MMVSRVPSVSIIRRLRKLGAPGPNPRAAEEFISYPRGLKQVGYAGCGSLGLGLTCRD